MTFPLLINVTLGNCEHPLFAHLEVVVSTESPSGSGNSAGDHGGASVRSVHVGWLDPDDDEKKIFLLRITIPDVLDIVQLYRIERLNKTIAPRPLLPLHPRLGPPTTIGTGGTAATTSIAVDLAFLDVTAYHTKNNGPTTWSAPGFRVVTMELTRHHRPRTWVCVIPDTVQLTNSEVQLFLFFRPESHNQYTHIGNLTSFIEFQRYMNGDDVPPTFLGRQRVCDGFQFSHRLYGDYQRMRWAHQIRDAGKAVVLIFPMPHGTSGGTNADFGILLSASADSFLVIQRLVRALWQEKILGIVHDTPPSIARFAVGGFSTGGEDVQKYWSPNRSKIDELYLFDPKQGILDAPGIVHWVRQDKQRRLALICPRYSLEHALNLAKFVPAGQLTLSPTRADYFYQPTMQDNEPYIAAHEGVTLSNTYFEPSDQRGLASTTSTTRIVLDRNEPHPAVGEPFIEVHGRAYDGTVTHRHRFFGIALHEAAAFLEGLSLTFRDNAKPGDPNGVPPFKDKAKETLAVVERRLRFITWSPRTETPAIAGHRHGWAVSGGENVNGQFIGYVQMIMTKSGFR